MWFSKRKKSDSKESKCIYIPATMLGIEGNPFAGNEMVDAFVVDPGNPVYCSKDGYLCKKKLCSPENPNVIIEGYHIVSSTNMYSEYQMTKDVYVIGDQAFKYSRIETVGMSPNIYVIGAEAFYGCENLQNVDFYFSTRKNIKIGSKAFADCRSLESIVLPVNLTRICGDAFLGSDSLVEIRILSATPPLIIDYDSSHPLLGISNKNLKLFVPQFAVDAYKKAVGWSDFKVVGDIIPNQDLFTYCLQDKNANVYKDLEYELFPISLEVSKNEVSVLFKTLNRGERFKLTYVDLGLLLSHLFAASHEILVSKDGVSEGAMFENVEIASSPEDVVWYTENWGNQNPREIFRFDRALYVEQIKKIVLELISICDQNPSILVRPSDLFSIEEIKFQANKMGWL